MTADKRRTITLTRRPPISIYEDTWPLVASAVWYRGEIESQADRHWTVRVRQHADGRSIVYYVYRTIWTGERDDRGGLLVDAGADLSAAILRVCEGAGAPERLAQAAIADLPAEELV